MMTNKKTRSNKNYFGNFIKIIKKYNFIIFVVFVCIALIYCIIALKNIVDIAYRIDSSTTNRTESSQYAELFTKIDFLVSSGSNIQEDSPNIKNPFSE